MKTCYIYPTGQPAVRWEGDNIKQIEATFPCVVWVTRGDMLAQFPASGIDSLARVGDWIVQVADGTVHTKESMDDMFLWDGEYETYCKLMKRFPNAQVELVMPFHTTSPDPKHMLMLMVEDEAHGDASGANVSIIQPWHWLVPDPNRPNQFKRRIINRDTTGPVTREFYLKAETSDQTPAPGPSEVNEYWSWLSRVEAIQWTGRNATDVIEFCPKCHLLIAHTEVESALHNTLLFEVGDRLVSIPVGHYIVRNHCDGEYTTLAEAEFLCRYTI